MAAITVVWVVITGDNDNITLVNDIFLMIIYVPWLLYYSFYKFVCGLDMSNMFDRHKKYCKKKKKHPLQKKK